MLNAREFYRKRLVELSDTDLMKRINNVVNITTNVQILEEYVKYVNENKLNKKVKKYIKNPNICPFCGSDYLYGGELIPSDNMVYRDIVCKTCNKSWTEEFELVNLTE